MLQLPWFPLTISFGTLWDPRPGLSHLRRSVWAERPQAMLVIIQGENKAVP